MFAARFTIQTTLAWLRNVVKCGVSVAVRSLEFLYYYYCNVRWLNLPNVIQNIQSLQTPYGCIFDILKHFATKLCKFTNFIRRSFWLWW